jgi:putative methyltransferase
LKSNKNVARKVFAFERDPQRSLVLKKMVTRAGGDEIITVHGSKDFLSVDPNDPKFKDVEALLLDPSCSGTGIVGRDDELKIELPDVNSPSTSSNGTSKKRKRGAKEKPVATEAPVRTPKDNDAENEAVDEEKSLEERLRTLSAFQLQLIQHTMAFPNAKRITYSTCSIHVEEKENVVMRALASHPAQERGWRILLRNEQPTGLKDWGIRGVEGACHGVIGGSHRNTPKEIAEACIRCEKGTGEGTMGFFVAAFVRDGSGGSSDTEGDGRITGVGNGMDEPGASEGSVDAAEDDVWNGCSDGE